MIMDASNTDTMDDNTYLKEISPHFISHSVFTPGVPSKPTNVGIVLAKRVHPSDDSYGTHPSKYGGIGFGKIDHPDYISTPKKANHLRTGVDWEISETLFDRNRDMMVKKNKAFYAQPINELGDIIFEAANKNRKTATELHSSKKCHTLFPKSRVLDYEYIRNEYFKKLKAKHETLETSANTEEVKMEKQKSKKVPCTPGSLLKLDCPENEQVNQRPLVQSWPPEPPFWYNTKQSEKNPISPRNINEFAAVTESLPMEEHNWLEEMALDDPKTYIPGEIYKNITPKQPVEDLSKSGSCSKKWKPRNLNPTQIYDIENIPKENYMANEVTKHCKLTYSESLGIKKKETKRQTTKENICHFIDRKKTKEACRCNQCKCKLDPKLEITDKQEMTDKQGEKLINYKLQEPWDWPGRKQLYIDNWGKYRAEEFQRVGVPFWKDATRWKKNTIGKIYAPDLSNKNKYEAWNPNRSSILY